MNLPLSICLSEITLFLNYNCFPGDVLFIDFHIFLFAPLKICKKAFHVLTLVCTTKLHRTVIWNCDICFRNENNVIWIHQNIHHTKEQSEDGLCAGKKILLMQWLHLLFFRTYSGIYIVHVLTICHSIVLLQWLFSSVTTNTLHECHYQNWDYMLWLSGRLWSHNEMFAIQTNFELFDIYNLLFTKLLCKHMHFLT